VPEEVFSATMANIAGKDIVLIGLFCLQNFNGHTVLPCFTCWRKGITAVLSLLNAPCGNLTPVLSRRSSLSQLV